MQAKKRVPANNTQPLSVLHIPNAHLKIQTVVDVTGLSASTIRRKVANGEFPEPLRQGKRCTRWSSDEVAAWLCNLNAASKRDGVRYAD